MTSKPGSASPDRPPVRGHAYGLTTQLLISVVAAVIITAVAAWIPESWLIRREFERVTWAQVEQGRRTARTLYNAWRSEVTNAALLTAQLPTLRQLLASGGGPELAAYLETVETSLALDLVLTCDGGGQVVAQIADVGHRDCGRTAQSAPDRHGQHFRCRAGRFPDRALCLPANQ